VTSLTSFRDQESDRIRRFMHQDLSAELADALILRAYERGIVGAHQLPKVIREWRNPAFEEFAPRTVWSLFNAFTAALRERAIQQPHSFAVETMRLNALLEVRDAAEPQHTLAT
jgi:hypothetical protein